MQSTARLAVLGAGLIGRRHVEHVMREARLAAIVDPAAEARDLAESLGTPWFASLADLLAADRPDGVVIATPTPDHVDNALDCMAAGVAALVEKPVGHTPAAAERLVLASERSAVPVLVGHHRRHNPRIIAACREIAGGALGRIIAAHVTVWFCKPEGYFATAWRREPGAGPIMINAIHEIDLLRALCGDIASVQAIASNAARGLAVEDSAAVLLRFQSGAIGTLTLSDAIVAPWSWELTAGENPAYPRTDACSMMIGGTAASLSIPDLGLWHDEGRNDWWTSISRRQLLCDAGDPLALQMRHFCEVALGRAEPLVPVREGWEALRVMAAIQESSQTGLAVDLVHERHQP
ncbi:putative dehydrogenase [Hoeflea marina]|uniref:Putative dehydrogenase n=1 Tax=Hoeflea marina TaxID=274592 RepID=A0A317PJT1_9HYPH|nr:Gfo/Idh/MocA family oxidoreductase [Hoeflea marina]PWV99904.1 putative dehydrogenase [Hoeflea marina]